MMNRGSIAEDAFIRSGLTKKYVSERLNVDPKTLQNKFQRPDLDYDFIINLYKILRLEVADDFPELGKFVLSERATGEDDKSSYQLFDPELEIIKWKNQAEEWRNKADDWRDKYYKLLEEYNREIKENRDMFARAVKENIGGISR